MDGDKPEDNTAQVRTETVVTLWGWRVVTDNNPAKSSVILPHISIITYTFTRRLADFTPFPGKAEYKRENNTQSYQTVRTTLVSKNMKAAK